MALNIEQKKAVVAEVADAAGKALSAVAAEYRGLTVEEMTELRAKARKDGVYLKVAKNTLVRRAVEGTEYECMQESLTGPLLFAFSMEDPGAAARLVKDYAKDHDKLIAKLVAVGGELYESIVAILLCQVTGTRSARTLSFVSATTAARFPWWRVSAEPAASAVRAEFALSG